MVARVDGYAEAVALCHDSILPRSKPNLHSARSTVTTTHVSADVIRVHRGAHRHTRQTVFFGTDRIVTFGRAPELTETQIVNVLEPSAFHGSTLPGCNRDFHFSTTEINVTPPPVISVVEKLSLTGRVR